MKYWIRRFISWLIGIIVLAVIGIIIYAKYGG